MTGYHWRTGAGYEIFGYSVEDTAQSLGQKPQNAGLFGRQSWPDSYVYIGSFIKDTLVIYTNNYHEYGSSGNLLVITGGIFDQPEEYTWWGLYTHFPRSINTTYPNWGSLN